MKAKRKLELKQRIHRNKTLNSQDLEAESEDEETYRRGNQNVSRAFDKYEDEYAKDDFGRLLMI